MSLQFIIGTASSNGPQALVEEATEWLDRDPKNDVFYLVPNHVKFETEIAVLKTMHGLPGYREADRIAAMRLQVFSFSRLAWYYLQNTAAYQKKSVTDSGKFMLIKQVLLEHQEELTLFRNDINKAGFIQQLSDIFDEFFQGNIDNEALQRLVNDPENHQDFKKKMADITLLYSAYQDKLSHHQQDGQVLLTELAQYFYNQDMNHVMFIVTGFSNFTAQEQVLLESLLKNAGEVKLHLILDQGRPQQALSTQELFFTTQKVYHLVYHLAKRHNVPILFDKKLKDTTTPMAVLDEYWQETQTLSPAKNVPVLDEVLEIWSSEDSYGEVLNIAQDIRRRVSQGEVRYQDIIILSRDIESYSKLIEPMFLANDIPIYINTELSMVQHPLVEFIGSLFDINQYYYRYKDVMRFLRTELFMPKRTETEDIKAWKSNQLAYRRDIDYTENVVLAYGYNGTDWIQQKDWEYVYYEYNEEEVGLDKDVEIQQVSNTIRKDIRDALPPFFNALEASQTGEEACTIFYQFLISSGVEEQIKWMREQEIQRGDLVKAKNHEQTWQSLMTLLDDYVTLLGELPFVLDDFIQILTSGMEGAKYTKVPTTLDQVTLTSIDMVRGKKSKVSYIIGSTDQVLPQKIENKSLLSNEERVGIEPFLQEDQYFSSNVSHDTAKEPYIFYLSLLSAEDKVIMTYPRKSDSAKELNPSPYIGILKKGLAKGINQRDTYSHRGTTGQELLEQFIVTDQQLLTDIIRIHREVKENHHAIPWIWQRLEQRVRTKLPLKTERVLASLTHKNIPESLNTKAVEALYGDTVYASVSKIESFYQCQYKYFLMYGLKLKERDVYELSPAAAGDFYHEALDIFFKELIKQKKELSTMSDAEVQLFAEDVLREVLGESKFNILNSSNRMLYVKYQLSQTIQRVGWSLKQQQIKSNMTTVQTEVLFGEALQQVGLPSLVIPLPKDKKVKVRGKIDRVDKMVVDQEMFVSVIDYKSSKHNFDYVDAYYGLALQMITYLNVVLQNAVDIVGQEAKPAGAFYLHVKNPILSDPTVDEEEVSIKLLEEYRMSGLLVNDEKVLENIDKTMEPGVKSLVYPYHQNKTGQQALVSKQFVSEEELNLLMSHGNKKFEEAGKAIFKGSTKLDPIYKDKERVACRLCPFRSVCQFDVMLEENDYHRLEPLSEDEIIRKINEEG